jgi:hypothetical protein
VSFGFFLVSQDRTDNTKKKERKKQQMTERMRERESPSTKNTRTTKAPLFAEKKNTRKLCLSTHQMASPEAAAILRELQGKNGNGVRV